MLLRLSPLLVLLTLAAAPTSQPIPVPPPPHPIKQAGPHHTRHADFYSPRSPTDFNANVLKAIDAIQQKFPDGGTYFVGVKSTPPESPIGYPLELFGQPLLSPPRSASYCSGASYTPFIEALNLTYPNGAGQLSKERLEALKMQEPGDKRREDGVKFWGLWNDDGPGSHEAALQYAHMADEIDPNDAKPGDFANISWTSGLGHSVVFLTYHSDDSGQKCLRYWSSQKGTNGLGDQSSPLAKVKAIKIIRITHPENLFTFDPNTYPQVQRRHVPYSPVPQ